ncbi:reverse transcriptase domain-containing protein [Tanacetum coccineum]|uniref:Reverse transcriptase domain-containing protein n=1 Tax=Tanacetum coccineum TaxID=301880 RepID=A0ABQ5HYN4_9ASTR
MEELTPAPHERSNASRMNATSSKTDERIDKLADQLSTLVEIVSKKVVTPVRLKRLRKLALLVVVPILVVTPAPVKAVEETCVTCGGAHSWYNCPATDNNQASVCATTGTYNQVNPPNRVSNQMAPPGFAPVQNNGQNRFNQNQVQGNNFNRGNNFHGNQGFQAQNNHAPNFQNQGFQNQPFQVPNNQVQQEISNDFSSYKRNNDQMLRNMQNQINSLKGDLKNEIQNTIKSQQAVMMNQQTTFQNNLQNMICGLFQNQASTSGTLPSNTIPNPKGEMKAITTRSGVAYEGPSIPTNPSPKEVVERETEETTDKEQTNFQGSTAQIPPLVIPISIPEPDVPKTLPKTTPIPESDIPKSLPKPNIPYPSRRDDQKSRDKASNQMEKIFQIFQDLRFDISFADALLLMPRFAPTIKSLLMNKEKLLELAKIPLNENCSAMLLKKLPEKLGDPGKFLIPCNFPGMDVCHALADLGASINLMPLSIWKKLSLPDLTPTRMTLELADRSITYPKGLAEDVFVKQSWEFQFPTDFCYCRLRKITLRVDNKAVTFNLDQTTRYSSTNDKSVNRIDIIDAVCEEYAPELLGFSNSSGDNPTPTSEPFTSEFILEEIEAYLKDDSISPEIDHADCDPEEDICLIEKLLNNDPFQLPPMDLKQSEVTEAKSSIEEPPELELKDLPSHLEYAFLEENDKLPVIIAKGLKNDEKDALLKVLKSHKRAIAWKITDIKGIDPRFCTHKILMEDDYKPTVQSQRRVNPKIHEVIKKEVLKLLDAGMIYPISDSPWVSPVHCVPKKGGITVVANEENELIPTRLVTGWRVCIDYRKLNEATRKDHFPLPFMDQMLERLARNEFYCFLDGFSGYFQIPIDPQDQEKTTFTCPYGTFAFDSCLSNLEKMLKRCKDTNLVLIGGSALYGREGIVIARPMTYLLEKETLFVFSKDCIDAFQTLKKKLTEAPIFDINPLFDEVLEDIECKDSYDSNLDELTFLVTPLSDSNKDECLTPGDDIEFLLYHDLSTLLKSVASILEGFINEPPFEENDDLFDLECNTNDWKRILYDAQIDKAKCFDLGGDNDEIDAFLAIEVPTYIEGYYDSEGDILYLESLLSDDTTHNLSPDSPENSHTIIESLPTSTTLIEDSDSNREEIDIFSGPYDSIPQGIESDFDSEEDIIDNLLNDDPIPEYERLTFDMDPDVLIISNVNEDECFDPWGGEINVEVDDSFTFVTRTFLPYLTHPEVSPLLSSMKK